jgi:xylulokinase
MRSAHTRSSTRLSAAARTTGFIGVDVGTTGVKTIAISAAGEVIARAEQGYPLSTPKQGWSEQDPEDWWSATQSTLKAVAAAGVHDVRGMGLSGQMHGLVCLDESDKVLRPAILWNDQRTGVECAEIEARVGLDRLIQLTGNRALTGFTAPKLLWLRRHEPDVYARIAHILLPKDYVRFRLTGERAIDVSDASGTLLFDVARRRWSDEVIQALEVSPWWLPNALESAEVSGRTAEGVAVAAGAGDQAAAALGVGVDKPGPLSVVLGTSGVVFAALPAFAADPQARVHSFCHAVPGGWHAMGVMLSAAGSVQWFRDALAGGVPFADLDAEAVLCAPGSEGLTFLPYLAGERTPHADPDARGAFVGLSVRHGRAALVRAVLEGVAYGLRDSLELLSALGVKARAGRASGGGARSRLWLQIVASVLGLPLELTVLEEGSAYGAALLAGVAGGAFKDVHEAVDACVRVRAVVEPERVWEEAYKDGYQRFRDLYPALRPYFQSSAAAQDQTKSGSA